MTNFKMNLYRNSRGALVADIYADGERVFASSQGYQVGCAFEAMGARGFTYEHEAGESFVKLGGESVIEGIPELADGAFDEQIFWMYIGASLMVHAHQGRDRDPEFTTIQGHLPVHLIAESDASLKKATARERRYFNKFVYFPDC